MWLFSMVFLGKNLLVMYFLGPGSKSSREAALLATAVLNLPELLRSSLDIDERPVYFGIVEAELEDSVRSRLTDLVLYELGYNLL